jgi:chorismate mutase/prephenate dehydratase
MGETNEQAGARIEELREQIDGIDREIVGKLNERATLALAIRELKPQVNKPLYDPKREQEIFESLRDANDGPLFDDNLRSIWDVVLQVMKEL